MQYNIAQLDFVLEMESINDQRITFQRPGQEKAPTGLAKWTDVLHGKLAIRYMLEVGLTNAMTNVVNYWRKKGMQGSSDGKLKPGVTRKGKPVDADDQSARPNDATRNRKPAR